MRRFDYTIAVSRPSEPVPLRSSISSLNASSKFALCLIFAMGSLFEASCKIYEPDQAASGVSTGIPDQALTGALTGASGQGSTLDVTSPGSSSAEQAPEPGAGECVLGRRVQCSFDVAGNLVQFPDAVPRGNCRYGVRECLPGLRWGPCLGTVGPKSKDDCSIDGDDANCNGAVNDGCGCVESLDATRACGTNVGLCRKGVQVCSAGSWGDCVGEIVPQPERCDGLGFDEDCDGFADLDDSDCDCVDGARTPCRLSDTLGDCALGQQRCVHGVRLPCETVIQPGREQCGKAKPDAFGRATGDEDCDGLVDEDTGPQPPLGCKIYHYDEDGDTWGAIGPSFLKDPQNATHGCFCGLPPAHLDHFVPATPGRQNRDCGDCKVSGIDVRPSLSISTYFGEPSRCLQERGWRGGVYDYNCNGVEEAHHPGIRTGSCIGDPVKGSSCRWSEDSIGFWAEKVPACGDDGWVLWCREGGSGDNRSCEPVNEFMRTQSCN